MTDHKILRQEIISKTIEYHQARFGQTRFVPGKTRVNYAGRVFDEKELSNAVEASLDFWLTEGRYSEEFSEKIAELDSQVTKLEGEMEWLADAFHYFEDIKPLTIQKYAQTYMGFVSPDEE